MNNSFKFLVLLALMVACSVKAQSYGQQVSYIRASAPVVIDSANQLPAADCRINLSWNIDGSNVLHMSFLGQLMGNAAGGDGPRIFFLSDSAGNNNFGSRATWDTTNSAGGFYVQNWTQDLSTWTAPYYVTYFNNANEFFTSFSSLSGFSTYIATFGPSSSGGGGGGGGGAVTVTSGNINATISGGELKVQGLTWIIITCAALMGCLLVKGIRP